MQMTFRWYGAADPVSLAHIRQIPGVDGIVSALYDVPVGQVWPKDSLARLHDRIGASDFRFAVVESIPVHEDIKLGRGRRDWFIDAYCQSIMNMGELKIPVLCYNFMAVFDWTRTDLDMRLDDGALTLAYDHSQLDRIDLALGTGQLPGWATSYSADELQALLSAYRDLHEEQLWDNLAYFLERVVPVAEASGVKLAIHPDDPPWSIFGLPRIITDVAGLERLVKLVESPANGITFCTGSLGALARNNLPEMIRQLGAYIHFAHCRNVRITGEQKFHETAHPTRAGDVDMRAVLQALHTTGFAGPIRPDHGRMIWGEVGRPGYGLHDRALGAMYLQGLWEGIAD
jgi:mannonate dehydratase